MILLRLELDGFPPTVNHMYINARGRRFRSKECKDYQEYVEDEISRYGAQEWPFLGRVALTLIFTAPDKRRWDISNRIKSIEDCLARGGVIKDDSQVDELIIKRIYGTEAKTDLILEELKSEE